MLCFIQWLQQYGVAVQALATVFLVAVTIVYACLTRRTAKAAEENARAARKLAESTEQMKMASLQLAVVLYEHRPAEDKPIERLELVNEGLGPALDVCCDIFCWDGDVRSEKAFYTKDGFPLGLAPDNRCTLDVANDFVAHVPGFLRDGSMSLTVQYRDIYGGPHRTEIRKGQTRIE